VTQKPQRSKSSKNWADSFGGACCLLLLVLLLLVLVLLLFRSLLVTGFVLPSAASLPLLALEVCAGGLPAA
jgi:hypothetical protein